MICIACGRTTSLAAEIPQDALIGLTRDRGFVVSRLALEGRKFCGEACAQHHATSALHRVVAFDDHRTDEARPASAI
jgi:hypothetical protein